MQSQPQHIRRCLKCRGLLKAETIIKSGISILQFMCLGCGRPWPAGVKVRSVNVGRSVIA
jgi:hypothetical protein